MKKLFNNEKGATSVLVIFMLIIFVTLGAFAISSASSNIKFSMNAMSWNKKYYALDAEAEKYVGLFDYSLAEAETLTREYMAGKGFEKASYDGIDGGLQTEINNRWKTENGSGGFLKETFQKVYMSLAHEKLKTVEDQYPDSLILAFINDNEVSNIEAEMSFKDTNNKDYNIKIGLAVNAVAYDIKMTENNVTMVKDSSVPRMTITDWHQWMTPNEYESGQDLWDGLPIPNN